MINVTTSPGTKKGAETVVFNLSQGKLEFPSHSEARQWQFDQIFGENADLSPLSDRDRFYIEKVFNLSGTFSNRLVLGDPCRIKNLQSLAESLGRKVEVENYLVVPQY